MTRTHKQNGLTLTELIVVVAIVVLVAGTMVPMIRPVLKGRNVREAARIVNVAFASAQARAVEKQRPYGVWLERAEHADPSIGTYPTPPTPGMYQVFKLYSAEQPIPYAGDTDNARARIVTGFETTVEAIYLQQFVDGGSGHVFPNNPRYATVLIPLEDVVSFSLLNPGEKFQFDGHDDLYSIVLGPTPNGLRAYHVVSLPPPPPDIAPRPPFTSGAVVVFFVRSLPDGVPFPSNLPVNAGLPAGARLELDRRASLRYLSRYQNQTVPFKVFRQPRKTLAAPVDMPNGTTIDLSLSSISDDHLTKFRYRDGLSEVHPAQDIVIMFSPQGGIDRVYYVNKDRQYQQYKKSGSTDWFTSTQSRTVRGDIALFIGRDSKVGLGANNLPGPLVCEDASASTASLSPESIANLSDTSNIWVTIQGSRIFNVPNAGMNPLDPDPLGAKIRRVFYGLHVRYARQLSRSGIGMGGE